MKTAAVEPKQVYSIVHIGTRFKDSDEYFQANASVGFTLSEDWGVGFRTYFAEGIDSTSSELSSIFVGGEWRWFFEPTEFAIAIGNEEVKVLNQEDRENFLSLIGEAAYEWALTESLAFRFDFHVEFPLESGQDNSFYLGLGLRHVW